MLSKKRALVKPPVVDVCLMLSRSFYDQVDPRRRQELKDSRMVQEDHSAVANLPTRFIHQEFNSDRFMEHIGQYNDEV